MVLKGSLLYVIMAVLLMFLSFVLLLKKRYNLKQYIIFVVLYTMAVYITDKWLFPFYTTLDSDLLKQYDAFSIMPFKNILDTWGNSQEQWILQSIIRRTGFSTAVSVVYGFLLPIVSKRKTYLYTAIVTLSMLYAVQVLMIIAMLSGAVEKQFDTSMFLFELIGVSVGYCAYRFVTQSDIIKRGGKKQGDYHKNERA